MSSRDTDEMVALTDEVVESLEPVRSDERAFGRYLLQYEIASGGMASIYLARARGAAGFERPIAIKRIHPHLARKPAFVDMFLDEARLNARIAHPNVCSVLDFGEADGTYFMAMEYLVGQPLSRVLGAVSLRPELATSARWHALAARILADACQGLHAAHELVDERGTPMQVVHRDFTPHNVFVTYDGAVKVFDFGVARAEGRLHHTETGLLKGKLAYMSPEQLSRAPIDRRLDVWAAGVCLWELLTLRRLFGKRSEVEIVQAIAQETILKPSQVRGGVPAELDAITLRALDRDPAKRTPTARALARELNQFASTTGVSTALADVAELMAELFGEERERKLDVVANVLRSEDAVPLDMQETSAVQRSRMGTSPARPAPSSLRPSSVAPPSSRPASIRPPSLRPPPMGSSPGGTPEATSREAPEEASPASPMGLADMLEPASEVSLQLHVPDEPSEHGSSSSDPSEGVRGPRVRLVSMAVLGALVVLGAASFLIVASGALDPPTIAPPPVRVTASVSPTEPPRAGEGLAPAPVLDRAPEPGPETETVPDPGSEPGLVPEPASDSAPAPEPELASPESEGPRERRVPTRGSVNVAARGGWAEILVDGALSGRTPRSLSLSPGRHLIELRRDGESLARRPVVVRAGQTQRIVFDL